MNKRVIIALCGLLVIALVLAGCDNSTPTPTPSPTPTQSPNTPSATPPGALSYDLIEAEGEGESDLLIVFPVIKGMSDLALQTSINEFLMMSAMLHHDEDFVNNTTYYHMTAEVPLLKDGLASVVFRLEYYAKDAAYPVRELLTFTIDLATGDALPLTRFMSVADAQTNMTGGKFTIIGDDVSDAHTPAEWAAMVTADTTYYLTGDKLVIAVEVPHALGDYVEWGTAYSAS